MKKSFYLLVIVFIGFLSCKEDKSSIEKVKISNQQNEQEFVTALRKHLDAVEQKDLKTLQTTMSPNGKMELIQPSMEIIKGVDGFMKFHEDFFNHPNWSIKFTIISKNVGERIGVATTETMYREPERNGKPYFNRMTVTYTLEKIDGKWYIIKDHASSIEKTK